mmetsp:Transcript_11634/g.29346  ORF Transcript_11634/g.29346 Transcript_11634/m.29346 type:complete len:214 (-) Transcript_11634:2275-2916(-)
MSVLATSAPEPAARSLRHGRRVVWSWRWQAGCHHRGRLEARWPWMLLMLHAPNLWRRALPIHCRSQTDMCKRSPPRRPPHAWLRSGAMLAARLLRPCTTMAASTRRCAMSARHCCVAAPAARWLLASTAAVWTLHWPGPCWAAPRRNLLTALAASSSARLSSPSPFWLHPLLRRSLNRQPWWQESTSSTIWARGMPFRPRCACPRSGDTPAAP